MQRVLLLINPQARSGEKAYKEAIDALKTGGYDIINLSSNERGTDPNELIKKYKNEVDFVMIGGGDGSVNLALPALIETQIPLAVLPLGTANNLARNYNIPTAIADNVTSLKTSKVCHIDVGVVNDIFFVNVAGLGLSTEVNQRVSKWLKRHLGVFAFILTAIQLAFKMNPFRALIKSDFQKTCQTKSWQITICNGKHYGAGMTIKDNATLVDGKLHCLSTEVKKWWQAFFLIPAFMTGKYKKEQDVNLITGSEITIETKRKFQIDVDGDIKTTTPAHFKVIPKMLKILIPGEPA